MLTPSLQVALFKRKPADKALVIGSGSEATVYLGKVKTLSKSDPDVSKWVALKAPAAANFLENLKKEAQILSKFDHPNIVKMVDLSGKLNSDRLQSVADLGHALPLEISLEGSLFDLVFESKAPLPVKIAKSYFLQLLDGIQAIHSKGVIHRDLKLENFLLFESGSLVKISDFGLSEIVLTDSFNSKDLQKTFSSSKLAGSLPYMSPECHIGRFSSSTDLFSLAVAGFIMVFGVPPFASAKSTDKHYKLVASGNMKEYIKTLLKSTKVPSEKIDYDFLELFFAMTHPSAEQRPTISEVKNSVWIRSGPAATTEEMVIPPSKLLNRSKELLTITQLEET